MVVSVRLMKGEHAIRRQTAQTYQTHQKRDHPAPQCHIAPSVPVVALNIRRQQVNHRKTALGDARLSPATVAYIGLSASEGGWRPLKSKYCQGAVWRTGRRRASVKYSVRPGILAPPPSVTIWPIGRSVP